MTITFLDETPECRLGHLGPLLIAVWNSKLTVRSLELLEEQHRALHSKFGKVTLLSVVVGAAETPSGPVRERLNHTAEELHRLRRANVIAVLARGLGAIIARSLMAAVSLISAEKIEVFKTTDDAVAFVQHLPGQDATVVAALNLEAAVQDFVYPPKR